MRLAGHEARMGRRGMLIDYWWEIQRERDRWEDHDVGGWIILGSILERWDGGDVDWIGLAQDRNRWWALVNSVLNLRVPWFAERLSSGQASSGLSSSAELRRVS
jgi:hypothetical protein